MDAAVLFTPAWLDWQWDKVETGEISLPEGFHAGGRIRPAFEAHVSTKEGASRNQLRYSALIQGRYKWFPGGPANVRTEVLSSEDLPIFSAHYLELAPVYVTDRVASVRTWGIDVKYEPSIPFLNLNHDVPRRLFRLPWLEGSMAGRVGFSARKFEQGSVMRSPDGDYGEATAGYEARIVLFKRLTLTANYSVASDLWGDIQSHDLFEGSAELLLDERNHFTVGASYVYGEEEPTFEKVDAITGWVGIKF